MEAPSHRNQLPKAEPRWTVSRWHIQLLAVMLVVNDNLIFKVKVTGQTEKFNHIMRNIVPFGSIFKSVHPATIACEVNMTHCLPP